MPYLTYPYPPVPQSNLGKAKLDILGISIEDKGDSPPSRPPPPTPKPQEGIWENPNLAILAPIEN